MSNNYLGDKVLFDKCGFGGTNDWSGILLSSNRNKTNELINTKNIKLENCENDKIKLNIPVNDTGSIIKPNNTVAIDSWGHSNGLDDTSSSDSCNSRKDKWYEQKFNPRQYFGAENLDQIAIIGGKTRNDMLVNEMRYSDFNRMPPSFNKDDFEYGYSYLPPKDWYPLPPYPPVCSSSKMCPVQPVYIDNETMDLKEWHETQKITPPESINTTFIANQMNSKN